jgi:hypothetical protein
MFSLNTPSRLLLILTVAIASMSTLARGQTISGTIVGTVLDQQGGILSGVGVTATNAETALTYQGVTDAQRGMYVIPEVPPGAYRVRAQFSGFQTQEHYPVRVDVNRVTEEDFSLKISTSTQVVVVQSDAPMTDVNSATEGANFSQRQIREMPILSRDVNNLALLAPGLESVRTFSFASTLVPFSANGSWGRYNNFIVDSVSNNEPIFGGAATQFSNPDIFADYAILEGAPKAEFGRSSGATVNVITKSGSSKVHGTAFWFGQGNQFDAMTQADTAALLTSTPPSYEHKVGGTFGGPLGKKDTFVFLSYQYDRARTDLSNAYPVIATVPTSSGFSTLQNISSGHPSVAAMLGYPSVTAIPAQNGHCFAVQPPSVPNFPPPSQANPCFTGAASTGLASPSTVQFGSYVVPQGNLFDVYDDQASGRIDRRINDSNDVYGRYLIDDLQTPQAFLAPTGDVAYSNLGTLPDSRLTLRQRTQSGLLDERYARASSLNEVRFSYSRIAQGLGAYGLSPSLRNMPSATVADQFGGFGAFQGNFPAAGNEFTLGQDTGDTVTHSNIYEAQENFSLTRNRHFIKMGADYVRTQSNIVNVPTDLGHYFFGFPGRAQAGGFSNFVNEPASGQTNAVAVLQTLPGLITDSTGAVTGVGPNEAPLRESDVALFIQDDFHVRANLDLSVGLRYERFGQPIDGILKSHPAAGNIVPTSAGDFGPRLGIAWSPGSTRKTVIRAGYALMYNQMPLNIPLLMWQSGPISPTIATVTASGASAEGLAPSSLALPTVGVYPNTPLTAQAVNAVKVAGCSGYESNGIPDIMTPGAVPLINCSVQDTVTPNLVVPYVQNWTAGVQRELTHNLMFEVAYAGSKGTKLYQRQDSNPNNGWNPNCLANVAGITCLNPRINNTRGDITTITNSGLSTYHALQGTLNSHTLQWHGTGLTFTASYTYSHMIDTDSEIFGQGLRVAPSDFYLAILEQKLANIEAITPFPQCASCPLSDERGNSAYDRRHRVVFSELWDLPTPANFNPAAKAVLGGWSLNGIGTLQSGQPFSPLNGILTGACSDANGDGIISNDRPNIGNPSAPLSSVALLADPTCRSTSAGYVDLNGNSISPSSAHFVQIPVGTSLGGNAGRNILVGPGLAEFDFALFKALHWGESKVLEFRWEVYNVLNHPNPAYLIGNVYASNAQFGPGFAFSPHSSAAGVTGVIPENSIDATTTSNVHDFLSRANMNTGNRTMQFGVHFTF